MLIHSKSLFRSKTIWGGIVALLAGVAGVAGYTVTPQEQQALEVLLTSLASAFGGVGAIYGRIVAQEKIQ
jgi:branched-subunit amino acid ABC-type transport system permease component